MPKTTYSDHQLPASLCTRKTSKVAGMIERGAGGFGG